MKPGRASRIDLPPAAAPRSPRTLSLPAVAIAAGALACAAQAALLLTSALRRTPPAAEARVVPPAPPAIPAPNVGEVFGRFNAVAALAAAPAANIALHGVIARADPADGFAILAAQGGDSRLVHAGSDVADGERLLQVYAKYVVLEGPQGRWQVAIPGARLAGFAQLLPAGGKAAQLEDPQLRRERDATLTARALAATEELNRRHDESAYVRARGRGHVLAPAERDAEARARAIALARVAEINDQATAQRTNGVLPR
jgi:hypothetical protein